MSSSSGINPDLGGATSEMDTYSVFASVGAKSGLTVNSASGNLAQFFATGIAAQRLGANQSIYAALNASAPAAQAEQKKAEAELEETKTNRVQVLLDNGATPELAALTVADTDTRIATMNAAVNRAKGCIQAWGTNPPAALAGDSTLTPLLALHAAGDDAALTSQLRINEVARAAVIAACQQ